MDIKAAYDKSKELILGGNTMKPVNEETVKPSQNIAPNVSTDNNMKLNSSLSRLRYVKANHRFRLIQRSPVKGSPSKVFTYQKFKRRKKNKILSPRKLQFILPKVSLFSSKFKKHKKLRPKISQTNFVEPDIIDVALSETGCAVLSPREVETSDPLVEAQLKSDEDLDDENEDDPDDHDQYNEEYLSAFFKASSTIAHEKTLAGEETKCYKPRRKQEERVKALAFIPDLAGQEDALVSNYLTEVKMALDKDGPLKFDEFLSILSTLSSAEATVDDVFRKVQKMLTNYQTLRDDFVMFLTSNQAIRLGKYQEFVTFLRMREFVDEFKFFMSVQPPNMLKIMRVLQSVAQISNQVQSADELFRLLFPLLRRQPWLLRTLTVCLLPAKPYQSFSSVSPIGQTDDFEEINFNGSAPPDPADEFELVTLPDDDPKSSQECPSGCGCPCHCFANSDDVDFASLFVKNEHTEKCISCGVRFIDGRVFLQCGKILKPAKITVNAPKIPVSNVHIGSVQAKSDECVVSNEANCTETLITNIACQKPSNRLVDSDADRQKKVQKKGKK